MRKTVILSSMMIFFFIFGNLAATSQIVVKVIPSKPKVIVSHPAKANPGHTWIDGHWKWSKKSSKYVWIKGHWVKPARHGSTWVSGHWADTPKGYKWVPGHWKAPKPLQPKQKRKHRK